MKELTYIEKIYNNLNSAFSVNYMILQNLDRIMKCMSKKSESGGDLREQTSAEYHYDKFFHDYAEYRNDFFDEVRAYFDAETYLKMFKANSEYLLDAYNNCFGKNIPIQEVFSDRNIVNWNLFNNIFSEVESCKNEQLPGFIITQYALAQFLLFYDEYKKWLSAYEIFEVLENDINPNGSKSVYYGKPKNPDVFVLDFKEYHNYFETITKFLAQHNKSKKKQEQKISETQEAEEIALDGMTNFINKLEDRIGFANSHLMELGSLWTKLKYKLSHMSDGNFEVKQIYVHRNEILDLLTALSFFPELHELAIQISITFLGKNVISAQNKTKENT